MNQRLSQQLKNRKDMLEKVAAPVPEGGVILGQAPTQQQQQQMHQAQAVAHCLGVAQNIFNQVVAQMLTVQDANINPITHEKMLWLAEQCKGASPYVAQAYGFLTISEQVLPNENSETQLPVHEEAESSK